MIKEELAAKLGKNTKITTTRLGELTKQGMVAKTEEGNYKTTTKALMKLATHDFTAKRSRIS